jgi:hypothetical protein
MIGAFALFDVPGVSGGTIFAAVLTYRLIAFWLPIPPGIVAFFQLRRTVAHWEEERAGPAAGTGIDESLQGTDSTSPITSESKVSSS